MKKGLGLFLFGLNLSIFLSGCGLKRCESDCPQLTELTVLSTPEKNCKAGACGIQRLRDTALSVGARGGLAARSCEINKMLTKYETLLYRSFNFQLLLLDKSVLPPVLIEGRNSLTLAGPDVLRIADRNFHILSQARFVTAAPTWRDYLWMCHTAPETPDRSLLPRSLPDKVLWRKYVVEGWAAGVQQANLIFKENVARLKRDFEGMIRYRTLLAQNMVSPPFVAEVDLGVTGCPTDLNIHDRILRITALPALQCDSRNWKTEMIPIDCEGCDLGPAPPIECTDEDNARWRKQKAAVKTEGPKLQRYDK
jgi:defect-in-organelle-trafficking protein DotC